MSRLFVDVGGNVGQSIRFFDRALGGFQRQGWRVVSWEPNPHCHRRLKRELVAVGGELIPAAASDFDGEARLEIPGKWWRLWGKVSVATKLAPKGRKVAVKDLPAWLNRQPETEIWLKLDCEGAEYPILRRMLAMGWPKKVRVVYAEFHPFLTTATWDEHAELLEQVRAATELRQWG